jgi:hypothetical protein
MLYYGFPKKWSLLVVLRFPTQTKLEIPIPAPHDLAYMQKIATIT